MGNIVTPEQGYLPIPALGAGAISPYPWWLTGALAIWALLALLCCWLLLLLLLLRFCCKRWRHLRYAADRKSLRQRFLGAGGARRGQDVYAGQAQHFASAPLPPLPAYGQYGAGAIGAGAGAGLRDVYERQTVQEEFYGDGRPYVTAAAADVENRALDAGSESYSEEEISAGGMKKSGNEVRLLSSGIHPIAVVSDPARGAIRENIETNIERNITKNYIINEERNYYVQQEPIVEASQPVHNQEVQLLPGPSVTTINMAAERITDNTNWEKTDPIAGSGDPAGGGSNQRASSQVVATDPSLARQNIKYETQPNIYTHRPPTPVKPSTVVIEKRAVSEDDRGSTTSEMSGHDSESIYETIRVFTPKKQTLAPLEDEDVYRTAGIDEVEIEIKDLIRLQKANGRGGGAYDDILSSGNMARRHLTPRLSSASSSSTLNNLMPTNGGSQTQVANRIAGEEKKEETVTETIQTQQIQTMFRQMGQHVDDSAFFIPLSSSSTQNDGQTGADRTIFIPVSSTIRQDEQPALYDHRDRQTNVFSPRGDAHYEQQ